MEQRSWVRLATASNAMRIYGPLTARNGLKSSGYLDLHLSFCWIAFVTPLKKTPSLKSLVSTCSQFPEAKLSLYSACLSGGNSVWQTVESVFLRRVRSPSHLNQLFCNLRDLWIEFSLCLDRRLLKRRTGTIALSDLASRTYAGVEPINLSRT